MTETPQGAGEGRRGPRTRTRDELYDRSPALRKLTPKQKRGAVVIRDLLVFQGKLLLDGLIDLVMIWASVGAAILDVIKPTDQQGRRFYATMRTAERFDRWLNLYGATEYLPEDEEGPFGRGGADALLGRLEEKVLGQEPEESAGPTGGEVEPPVPRVPRRR